MLPDDYNLHFLTKPQHFHEFFIQIFFDNFSREIKVVNFCAEITFVKFRENARCQFERKFKWPFSTTVDYFAARSA